MILEKSDQIVALADQISTCANSIHEHLMTKIKENKISRHEAQSVFQNEVILRQYANSLYIDAVNNVIIGLKGSQKELTGLIDSAKEKIKTIEEIASFIDLVADLVAFAAAVSAKKPAPILAALKEIEEDVKALS
uniref:Uncharacterized protein n=1 Tax=Candidatus Kentrum sp. LFY TaxID=2126342 RepID=A0A450UZ70_9GAMM|nr:MAG: hypothetical protein BECKLFY1418A_GA0070994_10735 [Candidatus Kentron sp. LFY]